MRKTKHIGGHSGGDPGEILVSVRPEVLHDAEHAVGNLLQRIHHTVRVALNGLEGDPKDRVNVALSDLEGLLELLFDYVSPVDIEARPTEVGRVSSSLLSLVRSHVGDRVEIDGAADGKVVVDPRALSRCFQLIGASLGDVWKRSAEVGVLVEAGGPEEGVSVGVRLGAVGEEAPPVSAAARVGLAVAARLLEMQGGELQWNAEHGGGTCCVVLPRPLEELGNE